MQERTAQILSGVAAIGLAIWSLKSFKKMDEQFAADRAAAEPLLERADNTPLVQAMSDLEIKALMAEINACKLGVRDFLVERQLWYAEVRLEGILDGRKMLARMQASSLT